MFTWEVTTRKVICLSVCLYVQQKNHSFVNIGDGDSRHRRRMCKRSSRKGRFCLLNHQLATRGGQANFFRGCKLQTLKFLGLIASVPNLQNHKYTKKIAYANRKSLKYHICGRPANLENYYSP
jgi:hypothetical protein